MSLLYIDFTQTLLNSCSAFKQARGGKDENNDDMFHVVTMYIQHLYV